MIPSHAFSNAVALAAPNRPFICMPETYDGLRMLDGGPKPTLPEIEAAWLSRPAEVKVWPTKTEFWAEFSDGEKTAILGSDHAGIRRLVNELLMWSYTVRADDPRILSGMGALVLLQLITPERAEAILGQALT